MKLYDSLVAAAVPQDGYDVLHHFGREAMKRRPAAFRAAAPFTSLRLRREQQGELVDVSAAVRLPPSRVGDPLQVSAIPPVRMSPKARRVIRNSSAGAQEERVSARRRPSASPSYAARKTGGSGAAPTTELSLSEDILPAAGRLPGRLTN